MFKNIIRKPFRYTFFHAVFWLIGINVLVFALMMFFGSNVIGNMIIGGSRFRITISDIFALIPAMVMKGWIWSFVTYMFMHGGITHLLFNMLGLFIFGRYIERQMGSKEFLLYYFVTGILAGIFSFIIYFFTRDYAAALVGASGALYAVQLAFAVYNPNAIIYIWGILPLRAPIMVLVYTVLSIFFVITGGGGNVAHLTHLAGFGFGWLYFLLRFGVNPWRRLTGR